MERRKFLIGAGSAAIGSSALIGSGAFDSVQAQRDVTVTTAGDMDAFLKLEATSEYANNDGETIAVNLSGESGALGDGLNKNATTTILNVFNIKNQGTKPVALHFEENPPIGSGTDGIESSQWFVSPEDKTDPSSGNESASTWSSGQPPNFDDDSETGRSNINLDQFDQPSEFPNVLAAGDDVSVGLYIVIDEDDDTDQTGGVETEDLDIDGTLTVFAYSEDSASDAQS